LAHPSLPEKPLLDVATLEDLLTDSSMQRSTLITKHITCLRKQAPNGVINIHIDTLVSLDAVCSLEVTILYVDLNYAIAGIYSHFSPVGLIFAVSQRFQGMT
jgi:hypothetical protein